MLFRSEQSVYTTNKRLLGYELAYKDLNKPMNDAYMLYGDYYMESGFNCCLKLINMETPPTALIITNYDMTLGALMALVEKNIKIPEDISVIGYDNSDIYKLFNPPISMVFQPVEVMGKEAANLMLQKLKGEDEQVKKISIHKSTAFLTDSIVRIDAK